MFKEAFYLLSDLLNRKSSTPIKFRSSKSERLIASISGDYKEQYWRTIKLKDFEIGKEILAADSQEQLEIVLDLLEWIQIFETNQNEKFRKYYFYTNTKYDYSSWKVRNLLVELLRKKLPFSEMQLLHLLDWSTQYDKGYWNGLPQVTKQVEDFHKTAELTPKVIAQIKSYINVVSSNKYKDAQTRQNLNLLRQMAGLSDRIPLTSGETWSDFVIDQIGDLSDAAKANWIELLKHCALAAGSTPSAKWLKAADSLIEKIGAENYKQFVLECFPLVDKPRTQRIETWSEWMPDPNFLLNDQNADILKGLVWLCTKTEDSRIFRALTFLAISAYRKVPKTGPRCVRVGNACVWALGEMQDSLAVGQLALLKVRIKFGTAQKLIETALEKAALRANLPKDEIEEMSVPDYGLQKVGKLTERIGDYAAEIIVKGTDDVNLQWFNPEGKLLKSAPASLKKDYAEDLKELNQTLKDVRQMLNAQRSRIDCLYLDRRTWKFDVWRDRYLDHALIGTIARRLIWNFTDEGGNRASGIWLDGKIVSSKKQEIDFLSENVFVELWHPIGDAVEDVLAWREFLEENFIRQPFKQAHREVYLLTEAERNTNVYSNRYAAHILKQHQFSALCSARSWKNKLRLMVDADLPPAMRFLPKWNLRAEFWIEGIGDNYDTDTNATGTFLYLTTDQVRFYPIDARENFAFAGGGGYTVDDAENGERVNPTVLGQIPPLVFSEIMRDVDLFVGVASVGNDPNWLDSGADTDRGGAYWYNYSFGELSVSAKMRKQMLEKLIPRLKIAERCSFDDKFLVVRGDLRTYKIHLGSGNILMKPNDQYLCIVTGQGTAESGRVFLPFEGDQRTAVILSKAFLLAEDTKIKDKTILKQIK